MTKKLTLERLKELLAYDPDTGLFVWKTDRGRSAKFGDIAGRLAVRGYWDIEIDGKKYKAHRLAWLYVTGKWPKDEIDHRDMNRTNNKFDNLREATHSQNGYNKITPTTNTSGFKGVSWCGRTGKWRAAITRDRKQYHLGFYDKISDAKSAYDVASHKYHGEYGRTE